MADQIIRDDDEAIEAAPDKGQPGNPNEPMKTPGQNPADPSRGTPRNPDPDPSDPSRRKPQPPDEDPRRDPSREDR